MTFDEMNLPDALRQNLVRMGYEIPTPIQAAVIEPALRGRDVIGLARTGTGKTSAFGVPVVHHLAEGERAPGRAPRGLVICPTRELARQVADEIGLLARRTGQRTVCVFGKVGLGPQAEQVRQGADILVGTPGRIRALVEEGVLVLAHVRHVVLDEADRMLDMGFKPQIESILRGVPERRQLMLFTATMPDDVTALADAMLDDPVRVEVQPHTTTVEHVEQQVIPVEDDFKVGLLLERVATWSGGTLVFCATRRRVGWVGTALARNGIKAAMLHGDRTQPQRQKVLDAFARGEVDVVVATDVASRGLHIPAVRTVVNYDVPNDPEQYVHRIGRAAHGTDREATGDGRAVTFLTQRDAERWTRIVDVTGITPETLERFGAAPSNETIDALLAALESPEQRRKRGKRTRSGRSRAAAPIRKSDKPGGGVRKLEP